MSNGATVLSLPRPFYYGQNNPYDTSTPASSYMGFKLETPKRTPAPMAAAAVSSASTAEAVLHAVMGSHSQSSVSSQSQRKRRRSGPPDWEAFYKNGLPQEVIVIEDSPDLDEAAVAHAAYANGDNSHQQIQTTQPQPQTQTHHLQPHAGGSNGEPADSVLGTVSTNTSLNHNGYMANGRTMGGGSSSSSNSSHRGGDATTLVGGSGSTLYSYEQQQQQQQDYGSDHHIAKKRRRHDDAMSVSGSTLTSAHTRYDPVHNYAPSTGSVVSSERTHSNSNSSLYTTTANTAVHTAATSLASNNGRYDYDTANVPTSGQKRKRATRQQVAGDAASVVSAASAKKRDLDTVPLGPATANYRPPPLPPVKAQDVHVKIIHDAHYTKAFKVDDEDGHYIVVPDADLTERYQMVKLLGQGTFGKVVQARDRRKNEMVAIKIIRSVQKYRDASRIELRVLETLKANDRENRNRCIHLRECFDFRGHICIVMDLLGRSVFDFLKSNTFVPFPNSQIQSFARQLFTSVAYLKPENILLVDADYQTFTYNRKIPSSSTTVVRQATQRRVLLDTEIRLIDFGSATFQDEYHSSVVSTRHYRAPEIILGLGWSYPCDIWSIGCILVEFYTGDALFQTHDNLEHLAMMEAVCDSRIDTNLVQQVTKSTRHGGNAAAKYFKRLRLDYPNVETTRASRRFVKAMKKLNDIIPSSNNFLKHFLDLLRRIFVYDPAQRITAKEALQHPWFREVALQDDGTEAAKIRYERARDKAAAVRATLTHP